MTGSAEKNQRPTELPLLPLRDLVVFPHMMLPLFVGRGPSVTALEAAMSGGKFLIVTAQIQVEKDDPGAKDLYSVGTLVRIMRIVKMPDSTYEVHIEGRERVAIKAVFEHKAFLTAAYEILPAHEMPNDTHSRALEQNCLDLVEQLSKLNKKIPRNLIQHLQNLHAPGKFADIIAANLISRVEDKQSLLETSAIASRLEKIAVLLGKEIEILEMEKRIRGRVRKQMEHTQKEYYLNEQIKAIRRELGQDDDENEYETLKKKIKKLNMPSEAETKALKELERLNKMQAMSPESAVIRTYLETLLSLPWNKRSEEKIDLSQAKAILDSEHSGLNKVKERILEHLAVRKLAPEQKGPILCLVGPPGVGKTSLAASIARALNRNMIRIALGGLRDEAEIRGHRRTYIGALPGRIVQGIRSAKTKNALLLLDEIDKIGSDFRGDPAAALLEVLDPEQNRMFNDHYLEVHFDLSEVMFVCTANAYHNLHPTLRDRMEIIEIPGYSLEEKIEIARQHLLPRVREEHGLSRTDVVVSNPVLRRLIGHYTQEAGVRNLKRELASILRKIAKVKVEKKEAFQGVRLNPEDLQKYLGAPKLVRRGPEKKHVVGVAMGLAWTEMGGELLPIEVTLMPGKGQLLLTGNLGDVMKESAQAAVSYARANTAQLDCLPDFYKLYDIHIHVPEGAIPKDGPSAGIAIATALISALTQRAVRCDLAMTGEITLRGRVYAIGGLKEKLLAAVRAGLPGVIIPEENAKDLDDLGAEIRKKIRISQVASIEQVFEMALIPRPGNAKSSRVVESNFPPSQNANDCYAH